MMKNNGGDIVKFPLSEKYIDFLNCNAKIEILEGTTSAGKTTVAAGVKLINKVMQSERKLHILAGRDKGTIEKNMISSELGILEIWGKQVEYFSNGNKNFNVAHLLVHCPDGEDKIIFVCNYSNVSSWKRILGGQYGCVYLDEANISDIEFIDEVSARWTTWFCMSLNPDDPRLPIYENYINKSRPLKKYKNDLPKEINKELRKVTPKKGWVHWFFNFEDNASLTKERIEQIKDSVPQGTKMYKNKVLGLRGKATGIVFSNFSKKNIWSEERLKELINGKNGEKFEIFTSGLDTSYSSKSDDTIAFTFVGITNKGRCCLLEELVYNNKNMVEVTSPSDTITNYVDFLNKCKEKWGYSRVGFIDSADAATIAEAQKYKRNHNCIYDFVGAYKQTRINDRINLQLGWIKDEMFVINESCKEYEIEMGSYSWNEQKINTPQDGNDHVINSCQYAWLPYKEKIGVMTK
jgi:PBSX family phage terminase large subunit